MTLSSTDLWREAGGSSSGTVQKTQPPSESDVRRAWIRTTVTARAALTQHPVYGSTQWCALADDDPRKLAAALIAAECWATDQDELPQRLTLELDTLHAAEQAHWTQLHTRAVQIAHRAATPAASTLRKHYAQTLNQRIDQARRPRPGDHQPPH